MELDKVIKDLEGMKKAGFVTCNIQCFLDQLEKVTESIVVDKFIADWYDKYEYNLEYKIWEWLRCPERGEGRNKQFYLWLNNCDNKPVETLVKMKLYGYKVKKEKKYTVRVKGVDGYPTHLNKNLDNGAWFFASDTEIKGFRVEHTKYELEEGGFGEVFNSPLFEVKEVTNEKG